MQELFENLLPDYYSRFACKMGRCRTACCDGWPVALSMQDYFRLLGVSCSAELRNRLDVALRVEEQPSPEKYAEINHRYDGSCPLRLPDGRCAVHAELGEQALPAVCRLYPRAVRAEGERERSCAGSCEAVVELLLRRPGPIRFVRRDYPDETPQAPGRTRFFENGSGAQRLRMELIGVVQNRSLPLPLRLLELGRRLGVSVPDDLTGSGSPSADDLMLGLRTVARMTELIDRRSESLRAYGDEALAFFGGEAQALERYAQAKRRFEAAFPDWESFCENLLVNHMFFSRFPFAGGGESPEDEFFGICAVYALLRFLFVGWMGQHEGEDALVDVAAAAFRLIDHTLFHRSAAYILRELDCDTPERLLPVLLL